MILLVASRKRLVNPLFALSKFFEPKNASASLTKRKSVFKIDEGLENLLGVTIEKKRYSRKFFEKCSS